MHFTRKLKSVEWHEWKDAPPIAYGIELAKILDFPSTVIQRAKSISDALRNTVPCCNIVSDDQRKTFAMHSILQKLFCISVLEKSMDEDALRNEVSALKRLAKDLAGSYE